MKKSNAQKELEMSMNWLDIYAQKLEGIPGETTSQKIDTVLKVYKQVDDMADDIIGVLKELIERRKNDIIRESD